MCNFFNRNTKKKVRVAYSIALSFFFAVCVMVCSDWNLPISSDKTQLQWFNKLIPQCDSLQKKSFLRDSLLLIDVHYDKVMALKMASDTIPDGYEPITDRTLLKEFLDSLKSRNDYKYIVLDVFFEKQIRQKGDTALFNLISSMDNIVIPCPEDGELADHRLEEKAGASMYATTFLESDFVKYPYILDGKKSVATKMYEDITNKKIKSYGFLYFDKFLVRSSAILTFQLKDIKDYHYRMSVVLGKDSIFGGNVSMFASDQDFTKDKYILIGDFEDDRHMTYQGPITGTMISFNAYLAMMNGHHRYSIVAFFVLWIVLSYITYRILERSYDSGWFIFQYPFVLGFICFVLYRCNEVYDVLFASLILYCLKVLVDLYDKKDKIIRMLNKN